MSQFKYTRIRNQYGMTLLEVLVATAILAIISGMAFLSLDNLAKSKQTLDVKTEALNQFNRTQFMFQNDLQLAISAQQTQVIPEQSDFIGNSQSMTFLRYQNVMVTSKHQSTGQRSNPLPQPMIRVKWFIRNQQWIRATQNALSPLNSNQWQEQYMLDLKSLNCAYKNLNGLLSATWPNTRLENSLVPVMINCEIQGKDQLKSVMKIVPWQNINRI